MKGGVEASISDSQRGGGKQHGPVLSALKAAFPYTLPIFAGFWFLGLTYGMYMNVSGFSFLYPLFMSMLIYAGSMEFITVSLLLGAFNPVQAFLMTLMINARHLFYGLSMLEKFKGMGAKSHISSSGCATKPFPSTFPSPFPLILIAAGSWSS